MELERDLFLTKDFALCEAGTVEAAFLFHRKGQLVTPQEDLQYGVSVYLERSRSQQERAERHRMLAQAKAVALSEVEDKAVAGPMETPAPRPPVRPTRPPLRGPDAGDLAPGDA